MAGAVMDPEKIKHDHQMRTERIMRAAEFAVELGCLVQLCYELAAIWREEAMAVMEANKKGCKTQAEGLREAAARISAFAVAAHKHGLPDSPEAHQPQPDLPPPLPQEKESTLDSEAPETVAASSPGDDPFAGPNMDLVNQFLPLPPGYEFKFEPGEDPFAVGNVTPKWAKDPDVPVFQLDDDQRDWLPSPGHKSPSQAETAAGCGMKWWLRYRRGAPERPSWASIGGSALHACIEDVLKSRAGYATHPQRSATSVQDHFLAHLDRGARISEAISPFPMETWHASRGGKENQEWWEHDGPEMLHRWFEWWDKFTADGWELLYMPSGQPVVELEIANQNGVKMVIDSAWIHRERKTVAIIDWKSGSAKPADFFQPTTYALALMEENALIGIDHILGAFWDARSGELGPMVNLKERHTIAEVKMRLDAPRKMDFVNLYMPNVNSGYGGCGSCGYRLSCPVGSRRGTGEQHLTGQ